MRRVPEAVLDVAIEDPAQRLDRIARHRALRERPIEVGEAIVDDALDERGLVAEVMVNRGGRDAGTGAHLANRQSFLARAREQMLGGVEDRAPGRLGLEIAGAQGAGLDGHGAAYSDVTLEMQGGPQALSPPFQGGPSSLALVVSLQGLC